MLRGILARRFASRRQLDEVHELIHEFSDTLNHVTQLGLHETYEAAVGVAREHAEAAAEAARVAAVGVAREHAEAAAEAARLATLSVADERLNRLAAEFNRKLSRLQILMKEQSADLVQPEDNFGGQHSRISDSLYAEIEDRFRGSSDEIRKRQQRYLDAIRASVTRSGGLPVLDLGCGRGEFLDLLAEFSINASGVDGSQIFVTEGRERGLSIDQNDALKAVSTHDDMSLSAISIFHLVEHLPMDYLADLLAECARVLHPEGVLLIETPNCASLSVTGGTFWIDPTHIRPLHPEVLRFLIDRAGFSSIGMEFLHEVLPSVGESGRLDHASELERLLFDAVFGFGDVAVSARL